MQNKTGYSKGIQVLPPNPQAVRIKDALAKVAGTKPKVKPPRPKPGVPLPKGPRPVDGVKPHPPKGGAPAVKGPRPTGGKMTIQPVTTNVPRPTGAPVRLSRAAKRGL